MSDRTPQRWAPWWHYVLVLAVANGIVQAVGLRRADPITNTVTTIVLVVAIVFSMTWLWRRGDGASYGG